MTVGVAMAVTVAVGVAMCGWAGRCGSAVRMTVGQGMRMIVMEGADTDEVNEETSDRHNLKTKF